MSYFDDLRVVEFSHRIVRNHVSPIINPPFGSLGFLRNGAMLLTRDGVSALLAGPALFWAAPGRNYQFACVENKNRENYWLDVAGPRADRIFKALETRFPVGRVSIRRAMEVTTLYEEIKHLVKLDDASRWHQAAVLVETIVGVIHDEFLDRERGGGDYSIVMSAATDLKTRPFENRDFREIARNNGMSYDSFRRKFKFYLGRAPHDYLLCRRMEAAAKLLQTRRFTVKELAFKCGFSDPSSFSRMFKKKSGVYPSQYLNLASVVTSD